MMPDARIPANEPNSPGYGAVRLIWTVSGSTTLVSSIESNHPRHGEAVLGSTTRSTLYFTSSAVIVWPLWNLTFGRRWKMYVFPPFWISHFSASIGTILFLVSYPVRLS